MRSIKNPFIVRSESATRVEEVARFAVYGDASNMICTLGAQYTSSGGDHCGNDWSISDARKPKGMQLLIRYSADDLKRMWEERRTKRVTIVVDGGVCSEVYGSPGVEYRLVDWDNIDEGGKFDGEFGECDGEVGGIVESELVASAIEKSKANEAAEAAESTKP